MTKTARIVGAGSGISASFARLLAKEASGSRWPPATPLSSRGWPPRPRPRRTLAMQLTRPASTSCLRTSTGSSLNSTAVCSMPRPAHKGPYESNGTVDLVLAPLEGRIASRVKAYPLTRRLAD